MKCETALRCARSVSRPTGDDVRDR